MKRGLPASLIRSAAVALTLILLVGCVARGPRLASVPPDTTPAAAFVSEIATTVSDLEASTTFLVGTLGAEALETQDVSGIEADALLGVSGIRMLVRSVRLGGERLSLVQFIAPEGAPARADARSNDLDFQHIALVVRDIDLMHQRVTEQGVTPVSVGGPQRIPESNPTAAGIRAFYFRDRDQRPIELIWYPEDKGDRRWHARSGPLLLGADHTAIAVSSTRSSRAFYEGVLGLRVRGEGLNEGAEQSALSGVEGARVRITGVGGPAGMGVEFLEYERPGSGVRPTPSTPTIVGYWEVTIHVSDLDSAVAAVLAAGAEPVSRRIAMCQTCQLGRRAFVVRDPDGHAVRLAGE